jgi:quercetin dioxygenase-like cupin family protein
MPIQRLSIRDATVLKNPGKDSEQLVWPQNAPESTITITRVTMQPGAVSTLHAHARAEQIWLVERGAGTLLMDGGAEAKINAGDIVRTPAGDAHGVIIRAASRWSICRSPRRRRILRNGTPTVARVERSETRELPSHISLRSMRATDALPRYRCISVPRPWSVSNSSSTACGTLPSRMTTPSTPFSSA